MKNQEKHYSRKKKWKEYLGSLVYSKQHLEVEVENAMKKAHLTTPEFQVRNWQSTRKYMQPIKAKRGQPPQECSSAKPWFSLFQTPPFCLNPLTSKSQFAVVFFMLLPNAWLAAKGRKFSFWLTVQDRGREYGGRRMG